MTDAEKIEAVNDYADKLMDWDRRQSKASGQRLEAALRVLLTGLLGRKPTPQEIADAGK